MAAGTGIFLIILGAILRFGLTIDVQGIDLDVVGTILMVGGAVGGLIGLIYAATARTRSQTVTTHPTGDGGQVTRTETNS